jgi:peptide/nickel transport system substrate-binding protein
VTIAIIGEPPTLDLTKTGSTFAVFPTLYNVLEPLVQTDAATLKIKPLLASSWTVSKNGRIYTFTLRAGAKFSTGRPVTAADVVFSYQHMSAASSPQAALFDPMQSVKALNSRTVRVVLAKRSSLWLGNMSTRAGAVFSRADFAKMDTEPIGSGPFKIDRWVKGDRIEISRNPHFDGHRPALSRVTFKIITDANAAANAMLAGDVDVLQMLNARDKVATLKNAGFVVSPDPSSLLHGLFFNVKQSPFDNVLVRRAVASAINKQAVVDAVAAGYGTPTGSWLVETDPWYFKLEPYPYNVQKARDLLKQAGYTNGISFEMKVISNNVSAKQGELIALMLKQAGITANIQTLDVAGFLDQVLNKHQFVSGIIGDLHPNEIAYFANGSGWFTNWNNASFNSAVATAIGDPSEKRRDSDMKKASRILARDVPFVPLYNDVNMTVRPKTLLGWKNYRVDAALDMRDVSWGK